MIINPYVFGAAFDPDAQAFITAAGITDNTQKSAINTLVLDMKGFGIWTKMKAIYPFVGGTASTHKWNLKDPRDLDAAFRLVFNGGWTHSSTGVQANGTNAYGDTKLNMSTNYSVNDSTHISFYSRTSTNTSTSYDLGVYDGTVITACIAARNSVSYNGVNDNNVLHTYPDLNGAAFYMANRLGTTMNGWRNNVKGIQVTTIAQTRLNLNMFLANLNNFGSPNPGLYSPRQYAFCTIGDGLTDTEAGNFYTAVQNFNTTLTRQV
jgi:hypothetical protein